MTKDFTEQLRDLNRLPIEAHRVVLADYHRYLEMQLEVCEFRLDVSRTLTAANKRERQPRRRLRERCDALWEHLGGNRTAAPDPFVAGVREESIPPPMPRTTVDDTPSG